MSFANMTPEDAIKLKKLLEGTGQFLNKTASNEGCLHKACTRCNGTGITKDGGFCIHGIACPCSGCSVKS